MALTRRASTVIALGSAQTLAWASSYYLLAILALPMARDVGVSVPTVFAAFSIALLVSAVLGPLAGRTIDQWGGRPVLMGSNLVFALGLSALALAHGPAALFAAWAILGVAMGSGLYEAAFASLVRLYGKDSRNAITGITLLAGFASTVGWPLSTLLESQVGWRGACLAWAGLHIAVGLPLSWSLPSAARDLPRAADSPPGGADPAEPGHRNWRAAVALPIVFAATWFTSTAMATHLPRLLQLSGMTLAAAVGIGALIGPAQVGGRLLELGVLRRIHPLLSARLATLLHPIGATLLGILGAPVAAVFALMHGVGNGILTIANGTLPLLFFGPAGYGRRQGLLMVPSRIAQALSPWLFGVFIDRWGSGALWLTAALGSAAFLALLLLRPPATAKVGTGAWMRFWPARRDSNPRPPA
jgi:predicted MFS family arabinose efflux permease